MPDAPDTGTLHPDPPADLTGRTLGDYQVQRRLGVGGMGQVYLARQVSLKRDVALKFLRNDLSANPTALKRFEAEAQAVARLSHANIVQVYQIGEAGGLRFMALEYVEGRNLRDHLARKGPPDLPVALSVIRQVAAALQKAHEAGIVHRDIKPENILVTRKVEVKVTDFGLSRYFTGGEALHLTQSGVTLGTPLYLSPEQAQGSAVDHRSDVYSLGVTCYHMLAGEPPFKGTTAVEVALKHVTETPKPLADQRPDLPADLCGMVHKMMAKNPADRYQTAREILRDLAKVREGLSLGLTQAMTLSASDTGNGTRAVGTSGVVPLGLSQSQPVPAVPPVRWFRWVAAGLAVVLAAAGGIAGYALMNPPAAAESSVPTPPAPGPPAAGLPDVRPSEPIRTTRERDLIALIGTRGLRAEKIIDGYIELGLLYVRERRLDEAMKTFVALAAEKLDGPLSNQMADKAGRLGQAVVLAHQDKAQPSVDLFEAVLRSPKGPAKPDKGDREAVRFVNVLLLTYPELGQAVAEALNRDAVNLGVQKFDKPNLEALRSPRGVPRKE